MDGGRYAIVIRDGEIVKVVEKWRIIWMFTKASAR